MKRREFVVGVSAALLGPRIGAAGRRPPRLDRVGVQLYTVRSRLARDFEGTLAAVAAIGYSEVEFAGYFDHAPRDVRALLDRHGLVAPAAHISTITGDAWRATLDAAATIGHRWLVVPWIPEERRTLDGYKRTAEAFNRAGADAHGAGLRFAFHNHDFEFAPLGDTTGYDLLLAETDPALVEMELDLYWITKAGYDPLAYFARWPGRFPIVHVKDSAGPPDHSQVEVGRGTIPFARIFAQTAQAGIHHWFVEHDQPADPLDSIRTSYRYLKRLEW
jgi:sugar phosphate isomerase/epimerase